MSTRILGIDIGSTEIKAVIAEGNYDDLRIMGVGRARSIGIKKGGIKNIDEAYKPISAAVNEAQRMAGIKGDKTIVSISGNKDARCIEAEGRVTIPQEHVTIADISRALNTVLETLDIPENYDVLHIIPYKFKIDNQDDIDDPLGMQGKFLSVSVYIIMMHKTLLSNLRQCLNKVGIKLDNIVLSSYASAISALNEDEKKLGATIIDMGGETCNFAVYSGKSINYQYFLAAGSEDITLDLSSSLHTSISKAQELKFTYGSLIKSQGNECVEIPSLGEDNENVQEISVEIIKDVIKSRIAIILILISKQYELSNLMSKAKAGIVLTGGMAKMEGIKEAVLDAFNRQLPVRVARPKGYTGYEDILNDPSMACVVGLCMYGSGHHTPYEIDSENKLRYKDNFNEFSNTVKEIPILEEDSGVKNEIKDNLYKDLDLAMEEEKGIKKANRFNIFNKFFDKLKDQF